jgi:hypothetical protein
MKRAKRRNEIMKRKNVSVLENEFEDELKKKKSNENTHFQTFDYENKAANTMRVFVKLRSV